MLHWAQTGSWSARWGTLGCSEHLKLLGSSEATELHPVFLLSVYRLSALGYLLKQDFPKSLSSLYLVTVLSDLFSVDLYCAES